MYVDPSGYEQSLEEYYSSIRTYNGTDLQKIPENYRAELDLIVEMNFKGKNRSGTNSAGWERNASKYFKQLYGAHPEYFSANNRELIKNNRSPVVDNQFVKFFPKYENYVGDTLIHHHIGGGGQVAAYPKSLHDGYGGVHNYEKLAGITGNDRLTNRAQTIEEGIPKEVKSRKKASSNKKSSKKCNS